jgi:hypothetical protein
MILKKAFHGDLITNIVETGTEQIRETKNQPNQRVDPTWTTPDFEGNV